MKKKRAPSLPPCDSALFPFRRKFRRRVPPHHRGAATAGRRAAGGGAGRGAARAAPRVGQARARRGANGGASAVRACNVSACGARDVSACDVVSTRCAVQRWCLFASLGRGLRRADARHGRRVAILIGGVAARCRQGRVCRSDTLGCRSDTPAQRVLLKRCAGSEGRVSEGAKKMSSRIRPAYPLFKLASASSQSGIEPSRE